MGCATLPVATCILNFGIVTGLAIALQNSNPMLLEGIGFSEVMAGIANCIFQVAGAAAGVGLGVFVTCRKRLRRTLQVLHMTAFISCAGMFVLCLLVSRFDHNDAKEVAILAMVTLQGVSVVGLLPFTIQEAVYLAHPATENFIAGVVTTIGMALGAGLNE